MWWFVACALAAGWGIAGALTLHYVSAARPQPDDMGDMRLALLFMMGLVWPLTWFVVSLLRIINPTPRGRR